MSGLTSSSGPYGQDHDDDDDGGGIEIQHNVIGTQTKEI